MAPGDSQKSNCMALIIFASDLRQVSGLRAPHIALHFREIDVYISIIMPSLMRLDHLMTLTLTAALMS